METNFFIQCRFKNNFKAFTSRLKTALSSVTSSEQTAYIEKRFIGEDKIDFWCSKCKKQFENKKSFSNNEYRKSFHSLDHSFLICFLKKLDLGKISLIGSKYWYISKNRVYWTVVLRQSILILIHFLVVKVIQFLHIYSSFLH